MSGHRQDIELDDRTLIELIGGIALDLLENNYIEKDMEDSGRFPGRSAEIFRKRLRVRLKMLSGITIGIGTLTLVMAAILVKRGRAVHTLRF
ncbi:MAG TPA: hypothetical protein IAC64_00655 [Candidatus Caccomorpha excrementavium]|nr:hypothetical protein [Candidatus Caccomorpha excrementavium]